MKARLSVLISWLTARSSRTSHEIWGHVLEKDVSYDCVKTRITARAIAARYCSVNGRSCALL